MTIRKIQLIAAALVALCLAPAQARERISHIFYGTYYVHNVHYNPDGSIAAEDDTYFTFRKYHGSGLQIIGHPTPVFPVGDTLIFDPSGRFRYHAYNNSENRAGSWSLRGPHKISARAKVSDGQRTRETFDRRHGRLIMDIRYSGGYRIHVVLLRIGKDRATPISALGASSGHGPLGR
jgi:hypothetical protein